MSNKYLDFINDDRLIDCVKHVLNTYPSDSEIPANLKDVNKNGIDVFKAIFDMENLNSNLENWKKIEIARIRDKQISNKIGEFHQLLLGNINGWIDLGIGDESHLDLKNKDGTIFIELKNKENTVNADSKAQVWRKLKEKYELDNNCKCYFAYIIAKNMKSYSKNFKYSSNNNDNIKIISGKKVYELITNDPNALEKTLKILPKVICDIKKIPYNEKYDEIVNKLFDLFI
jgi:hypothetical protein